MFVRLFVCLFEKETVRAFVTKPQSELAMFVYTPSPLNFCQTAAEAKQYVKRQRRRSVVYQERLQFLTEK